MIGDNIKKIMEGKNISSKKLAESIGITPAYLSLILNNKRKNPNIAILTKIANVLGVPLYKIMFDNEENVEETNISKEEKANITDKFISYDCKNFDNSKIIDMLEKKNNIRLTDAQRVYFNDFAPVPIVGTIRAGKPILAVENMEGFLPVPKCTLDKDKEYFCLKVKGDSMNMEFQEGSVLLIEKTECIENGQIGVVLIDGMEATVKKIVKDENMITLIPMSTNPEYVPKMYDMQKDQVQIIGIVKQASKVY